jgi:hypothetical protein
VKLYNDELDLQLHRVEKPKFVKNHTLESVLKDTTEEFSWGTLTMDQYERVMVEPQNCEYPAIGLWFSAGSVWDPRVYAYLTSYLHKPKSTFRKCLFKQALKFFIYCAFIPQGKATPELYVVSWELRKIPAITTFKKPITKSGLNFYLDEREDEYLSEEEGSEFTLRNKS